MRILGQRRFLVGVVAGLAILLGGCQCAPSDSDTVSKGLNAFQKVTGDDVESDRTQWDQVYNQETYVFGKEPAEVVVENIESLPVGRALDIAMGEGRNAVFLAKKGFIVEGVDLSEVAIRKAKRLAKENKVEITTTAADLNVYQIRPESYEVILNIQYLQRSLIPQIKRGLKRGGVVVFENQTLDQLKLPNSEGIRRDFLLGSGELRELFKEFKILHYSEKNDGKQAVARLIAMKP
jgi:2-polyprenyl-3-methyl-5-hydroxy-6-metoxy-1,4-benzoquinol methylase